MKNRYYKWLQQLCMVCAVFIYSVLSTATARAEYISVLAVTDFYDTRQSAEHKWLGIALSDMLIADLASLKNLVVLDRENLRVYFNEAELSRDSYVQVDHAGKLGGIAKANKVLTGSYTVSDDGTIVIEAVLVDVKSRQAEQSQRVEGAFADLFKLQSDLARKIADNFSVETKGQLIQQPQLVSLDAASHFYEALRLYEMGKRETALAEVRTALKADPDYLPAQFWMARLYSEIGEYDHAVQALGHSLENTGLKRLYRYHMTLLLAEIQQRYVGDTAAAIALLQALDKDYAKASFESVNAAYRLAVLYEAAGRQREAFELYHRIAKQTQATTQILKLPYKSVKLSPFLELRRYAEQRYPLAFFKSIYKTNTKKAKAPSDIILLTPDKPEYTVKGKLTENLYVYLPKGYNFKNLKLILPAANMENHFPSISTLWPDFTKKAVVTRLYKTEKIKGRSVRTFDLWAKITPAVMIRKGAPDGMRIVAEFGPDISQQYIRPNGSWTNPMIDNHFAYPKLLYTEGHKPGHAKLLENDTGAMWIVYDNHRNEDQHARGEDADLWMFYSDDKENWQRPKRLNRINSTADDTMPNLLLDHQQRYRMLFVSNRSGADELWISSSSDGLKWKGARRLQIPHPEKPGIFLSNLTMPRIVQDQESVYRLAFYHRTSKSVMLTSSRDLQQWKKPQIFKTIEQEPGIALFVDNLQRLRMVVGNGQEKAILAVSKDGENWQKSEASFVAKGVINAIQGKDDHFAVVYGPPRFSQATSSDWREWDVQAFPSGPYTDARAGGGDVLQGKEGYFWIALPKKTVNKIQLFRMKAYPAETLLGALEPLNGKVPRALKAQFELEEAALKARKSGNSKLWSCINAPEHHWNWKQKCF